MGYSVRPAGRRDFAWCAEHLEDGFEREPHLKAQLPRLWWTLMGEDALAMIVTVDDLTSTPVAFGAGGLVSDDGIRRFLDLGRPHLAVHLMAGELAGRRWLLRPTDIRRVNHPGHGVNLCVLHYSELNRGWSFEQQRVIRDKAVSEMLNAQRGYAAKAFFFEFYGEDDLAFTQVMGARLRTDYADYYARGGEPLPPPPRRPFLVGLSLDEVASSWGSPVGMLFGYVAPRLCFTPMQQRLLVRACRTPTPTDPELANELVVERSTLRDHWRGIFSRVAAAQETGVLPRGVLPHFSEPSLALRPALLAYLKDHPEELRPVDRRYFGSAQQPPPERDMP